MVAALELQSSCSLEARASSATNVRHAPSGNARSGPPLALESRTNTVPRSSATSMHSQLIEEALLFRHDAGSGLFGSDIEPLSESWGTLPQVPSHARLNLRVSCDVLLH